MTAESATRHTVRTYHDTRYRGDAATAAAQIGDGFSFRSPFITSDSPLGHLDGLDGFLGIVVEVDLISELYGDSEATLVYNVHTSSPPESSGPPSISDFTTAGSQPSPSSSTPPPGKRSWPRPAQLPVNETLPPPDLARTLPLTTQIDSLWADIAVRG